MNYTRQCDGSVRLDWWIIARAYASLAELRREPRSVSSNESRMKEFAAPFRKQPSDSIARPALPVAREMLKKN